MPRRVPSYRCHAATGQAVVTLNGKDIYLGAYDTAESRARYDRAIGEWLISGRLSHGRAAQTLSVNQVIVAFYTWALDHYRAADGIASREPEGMKLAFRPLKQLYGDSTRRHSGRWHCRQCANT